MIKKTFSFEFADGEVVEQTEYTASGYDESCRNKIHALKHPFMYLKRGELDSEARLKLDAKRWREAEEREWKAGNQELAKIDAEIAKDQARWDRQNKPKPKVKLTKRQIDNAYAKSKKVHEQEIESK